MKKKRGEFGYIKARKKNALLMTIAMAAAGIAVFVAGILLNGGFLNGKSNQNIFTVIAVLFVLPGAKYLVAFIVMFPHKSASLELYEKTKEKLGDGMTLYSDLVITSTEKVMHLDFLTVGNKQVIGLLAPGKQDLSYIRKYLTSGVHNWGEDYKVKIVDSEKTFLAEIAKVPFVEADPEEEAKVESYLISLIV